MVMTFVFTFDQDINIYMHVKVLTNIQKKKNNKIYIKPIVVRYNIV